MLLGAVFLATAASASAQPVTLVPSGDTLRASAPSFHFIEGPVVDRLRDVPVGVARLVLDYERRHRGRATVISAAETRVPAS